MMKMYSSIQKKYSVCIDCKNGIEVPVIAERCSYHYKIHRAIIQMDRQKERNKIRSLNQLEGNKEMVDANKELKEWFAYHMANSPKVCENCKKDLSHYSEKEWRGSQDHIIEKSAVNGCPSVAAVLENHCVLGMFCCHGQKHTSNLNLSRMDIFPVLKERFKKFKHLIIEEERRKIPKIFL